MATCNICGGETFVAGFLGRMSFGLPPVCGGCGSSERHRIVRRLFEAIRPIAAPWRVLQFAPDMSVDATWFASYQFSIYGGANSLDMMNTGLEAGSFDLVLSNHVLEHVPDDFSALREMLRLVGPSGLVVLTAPTPLFRWESVDWGFADEKKNMHFRDYGADFPSLVVEKIPNARVLVAIGRDEATGLHDHVWFISLDPEPLRALAHSWQRMGIPLVYVRAGA